MLLREQLMEAAVGSAEGCCCRSSKGMLRKEQWVDAIVGASRSSGCKLL
jgi:hypothetical protein